MNIKDHAAMFLQVYDSFFSSSEIKGQIWWDETKNTTD